MNDIQIFMSLGRIVIKSTYLKINRHTNIGLFIAYIKNKTSFTIFDVTNSDQAAR